MPHCRNKHDKFPPSMHPPNQPPGLGPTYTPTQELTHLEVRHLRQPHVLLMLHPNQAPYQPMLTHLHSHKQHALTFKSSTSASCVFVMLQNMMHSSWGTCQLGGKMAQMSLRASRRLSSHLGKGWVGGWVTE